MIKERGINTRGSEHVLAGNDCGINGFYLVMKDASNSQNLAFFKLSECKLFLYSLMLSPSIRKMTVKAVI